MTDLDSKITLKLLIDARSHKVIFGEARKDFVDFMFSLLTLPLGAVIKLLSPQTMAGSIGKLYQSVENLHETYLVANRDKSTLLQPNISTFNVVSPLLVGTEWNPNFQPAPAPVFPAPAPYFCASSSPSLLRNSSTSSPSTFSLGTRHEGESIRGFVKDVITYMITDDLEVTPMSAISSIALINRFNLKDAQLEEKVVVVGMKEGLALLKASLESSTVLTDVFCSFIRKTNAPSHSTKVEV